ncbi:hypothetical protein MPSEU_000419400 [Mayamaea pseudoterrestris]|nr:hypothetical protein MPSEU_000419400 [Mayamaea pseudoterrestris]
MKDNFLNGEAIGIHQEHASIHPPSMTGLKGEAVRSALKSSRCIGYMLQKTPIEFGLVRVAGSGTLDFLHSKLTKSFTKNTIAVENKSSKQLGSFRQACLLTNRGHVVDRFNVCVSSPENAYLMTSPGHSAKALWNRLDPFVFSLDQVELSTIKHACIFTLASTRRDNVAAAFDKFIQPYIRQELALPNNNQCTYAQVTRSDSDTDPTARSSLLIAPTTLLSDCVGRGFTFCFLDQAASMGQQIWQNLVSEDNALGPIEVGALEYQTLQVESGLPAFGFEMTGHAATSKRKSAKGNANADELATSASQKSSITPASPLELHLESFVDQEKGCYLGQEGVASILKNPRGPPRSLYQVVFDDDFNVYEYESGADDPMENLTRLPQAGDVLYVLGSNQEISVGAITSMAEPGGTGDRNTVGLALIKRSDSILKQMATKGIKLDDSTLRNRQDLIDGKEWRRDEFQDPLNNLEVIIGDSFTVGKLRTVPDRRYGLVNMFDDEVVYEEEDVVVVGHVPLNDKVARVSDVAAMDVAAAAQESEAEAAALNADARRKAEKMEILRKRAEEALARRKSKLMT